MNSNDKIMITLVIMGMFSMFLLAVFGDKGFVDLNRMKKEMAIIVKKNESLNHENLALYRRINRLKNDPEFIENIARQELGMVAKDEFIFKFKKTDKAK